MWPFGKTGNNKRPERETLLDVAARRGRRSRWRMPLMAFAMALLCLGAMWAGARGWAWLRERAVSENSSFALDTLEITTDGWITSDQVRMWAGVKLGDNLLTLDLSGVKRDLELVPQVESATVERVLPHLLRLDIAEREPLAQVRTLQPGEDGRMQSHVFYLDRNGVVMPPVTLAHPSPGLAAMLEALPVLRGVPASEMRPGRALSTPAVRAALQLLENQDRWSMAGWVDFASIDLSAPEVLRVTTSQGAEVILGLDNLQEQVRRWRLVYDAGGRQGRSVATLDLSLSNNCPVSWVQAAPVAPLRARPANLIRIRRRNV